MPLIHHLSFDLIELSLFKNLPFNASLIYKIKASFSLVNISDTLPAGGCSAQALKPEMAGRWLFHYPARASDQEQSSQPGVKTGNDKLQDVRTWAHLFRCPVHPGYSRRRRTVSWAGDWAASVVGKSLKCLEILYTWYDKMQNKLSVWRNNKSEWRVWSSYLIWWGLIYKPGSLCVVETAEIWKIQIWKKGRDMFQQWQTAGRVSHTTENSNKRNRKYYCLRQHKSLKMLPP